MKYKIRYLFNKFYHLIKFIIPTFFIGMFSVNANVVPYECLQYEHYFNVASMYEGTSTSYFQDRSSNFYNLRFASENYYSLNYVKMVLYDEEGRMLEQATPTFINQCTDFFTNDQTGETEIRNNYAMYEYVTTDNDNTADIVSLFNRYNSGDYLQLYMKNYIGHSSNIGKYYIDRDNDKIIMPFYFRSNKSDLTFENVFDDIAFYLSGDMYNDDADINRFSHINAFYSDDELSIANYSMYYEENYFYYYTFDLVIPLTDFDLDYYRPYQPTNSAVELQNIYIMVRPNLEFLQDEENEPIGVFLGFSTAFFINDTVLSQSNWLETGINEWVISNNPSQTLGPLGEFFNNFNLQDNRGISQVITIPIRIVQSFLNSSCDSITLDIFTSRNDDNLTISSGCSFWSTMTPIKNLLNIFVDGFICFEILKAVYLEIDKLKDPTDKSKIERSDL